MSGGFLVPMGYVEDLEWIQSGGEFRIEIIPMTRHEKVLRFLAQLPYPWFVYRRLPSDFIAYRFFPRRKRFFVKNGVDVKVTIS